MIKTDTWKLLMLQMIPATGDFAIEMCSEKELHVRNVFLKKSRNV